MILKAGNNKNTSIALAIALISVVTIAFALASFFAQPNTMLSTEAIINQAPNQSSPSVSVTGINETNSLNATDSVYNSSSTQLNTDPVSLDDLNSITYKQPDLSGFIFSLQNPFSPLTTDPASLDASKFNTYTYGGYSVQQPDSTRFIFSFPDSTSQGQIAGSDAITLNAYSIQKIDFDATFIAPKISALGFDEMAIFATSDTNTYKGTEFGIRVDLSDGGIYGYVQEPNGNYEEVDFQMIKFTTNDGIMHHFTLIMLGSKVSFYIDGLNYGYLNFPSGTDYSDLTFSILVVVHRFTDDWDSNGDNMIAENFFLNQQ